VHGIQSSEHFIGMSFFNFIYGAICCFSFVKTLYRNKRCSISLLKDETKTKKDKKNIQRKNGGKVDFERNR
jgi:hypothetical protein